ncbi:hypothetical protein BDN72DRAFT_798347 [Pluteus cervinus]|uniref:Uncharacterized protein n=1 Tax=Pluteus cervinus TaxID=181527 RepID=A0ACD3ARP7_9AGAR|nr:hypothetical protein BDN72DRAFT_798347 [Pluteus cervinus]
MTSPKLVAFIIGAGPHIGKSLTSRFREKGYSVAIGSRSPDNAPQEEGILPVAVDASKPESIQAAFTRVTTELGPPNAVVYNAASLVFPPNKQDPLGLDLAAFQSTSALGLNVFAAAQQAVIGFRAINNSEAPKAFIVTGNLLPFLSATPGYFSLGVQKSIEARLIEYFYNSYKQEGLRYVFTSRIMLSSTRCSFHYATLVSSTGGIPPPEEFAQSGPAHAKVYDELIHSEPRSWDYRFTLDGEPATQVAA